jgi:hypothetical protein
MPWTVRFADEFESEFAELTRPVQDELLAQAEARFDAHLASLIPKR